MPGQLTTAHHKLRGNALHCLELCVGHPGSMLAVLPGSLPNGALGTQVASLVAVLKVARQLNLVRDLDRVTLPGHEAVLVPEALLQRAIEHGHEALLVDAMALVCMHPKSTAVPGAAHGHHVRCDCEGSLGHLHASVNALLSLCSFVVSVGACDDLLGFSS